MEGEKCLLSNITRKNTCKKKVFVLSCHLLEGNRRTINFQPTESLQSIKKNYLKKKKKTFTTAVGPAREELFKLHEDPQENCMKKEMAVLQKPIVKQGIS